MKNKRSYLRKLTPRITGHQNFKLLNFLEFRERLIEQIGQIVEDHVDKPLELVCVCAVVLNRNAVRRKFPNEFENQRNEIASIELVVELRVASRVLDVDEERDQRRSQVRDDERIAREACNTRTVGTRQNGDDHLRKFLSAENQTKRNTSTSFCRKCGFRTYDGFCKKSTRNSNNRSKSMDANSGESDGSNPLRNRKNSATFSRQCSGRLANIKTDSTFKSFNEGSCKELPSN